VAKSAAVTAAVQCRTQDRTVEVLRLRRLGLSYRAIGREIGVSHTTCERLTERAFRDIREPDAVALRASELAHLNELSENLRPRCQEGDPAAVGVAVRLSERRCKLMGLDSSTPITLTLDTSDGQATRDEAYAQMSAELAVAQALAAVDSATLAAIER
jgi:hypothetical protein